MYRDLQGLIVHESLSSKVEETIVAAYARGSGMLPTIIRKQRFTSLSSLRQRYPISVLHHEGIHGEQTS